MEEERQEEQRQENGCSPWSKWQKDWFGIPGDVDDFIFYEDGSGFTWPEE